MFVEHWSSYHPSTKRRQETVRDRELGWEITAIGFLPLLDQDSKGFHKHAGEEDGKYIDL